MIQYQIQIKLTFLKQNGIYNSKLNFENLDIGFYERYYPNEFKKE